MMLVSLACVERRSGGYVSMWMWRSEVKLDITLFCSLLIV